MGRWWLDGFVYLAGAYGNDPEGNTRRAVEYAKELVARHVPVFCPHSHSLGWEKWGCPLSTFLQVDFAFVNTCKALFVLPLGKSDGVVAEVLQATKLHKPVYNITSHPAMLDHDKEFVRFLKDTEQSRADYMAEVASAYEALLSVR